MRKLPVIVAAACTLSIAPAFAQMSSQPSTGNYGGMGGRPHGEMGGMGGRPRGEVDTHRHGERGWRGMQEGCKYITVRQRQGDELIIRHFKRCD